MRTVWLSLCLVVACKGGSTGSTGSTGSPGSAGAKGSAGSGRVDFDDVLQKLEAYKARVCACTSPKCADDVEVEYKQYRETVGRSLEGVPEDAAFDEKGATIARAFRACRDARRDNVSAALRGIAEHRDTICACADVACADRANAAYEAWSLDQAKTLSEDEVEAMTPAQQVEAIRAEGDLRDCLAKLRGLATPRP